MCYSVMVKQDLQRLALDFNAIIDHSAFAAYEKLQHLNPKRYKSMLEHPRIYPNYFCPIIVSDGRQRSIRPMRYRIRPAGSPQEIPSSYNLFNARLDMLEKRKTWSRLFMRHHGILPVQSFYEWVVRMGKKQVIEFQAEAYEEMLVPVLFDQWTASDGAEAFDSFALITTEPPPEVLAAGHDRCPIFLRPENCETWLHPSQQSRDLIKKILLNPEPAYYQHRDAKA